MVFRDDVVALGFGFILGRREERRGALAGKCKRPYCTQVSATGSQTHMKVMKLLWLQAEQICTTVDVDHVVFYHDTPGLHQKGKALVHAQSPWADYCSERMFRAVVGVFSLDPSAGAASSFDVCISKGEDFGVPFQFCVLHSRLVGF